MPAQTIDTWRIGDWSGGTVINSTGYFERCFAATAYPSGLATSYSIEEDSSVILRVTHSFWNFSPGETVELRYKIMDNGQVIPGDLSGYAAKKYQALFYVPNRQIFL